jgi:hypothetical protein
VTPGGGNPQGTTLGSFVASAGLNGTTTTTPVTNFQFGTSGTAPTINAQNFTTTPGGFVNVGLTPSGTNTSSVLLGVQGQTGLYNLGYPAGAANGTVGLHLANNLAPGTYNLQLATVGSNGVVSPAGTTTLNVVAPGTALNGANNAFFTGASSTGGATSTFVSGNNVTFPTTGTGAAPTIVPSFASGLVGGPGNFTVSNPGGFNEVLIQAPGQTGYHDIILPNTTTNAPVSFNLGTNVAQNAGQPIQVVTIGPNGVMSAPATFTSNIGTTTPAGFFSNVGTSVAGATPISFNTTTNPNLAFPTSTVGGPGAPSFSDLNGNAITTLGGTPGGTASFQLNPGSATTPISDVLVGVPGTGFTDIAFPTGTMGTQSVNLGLPTTATVGANQNLQVAYISNGQVSSVGTLPFTVNAGVR